MAKRKMLKTASGPEHGVFLQGLVYDFGLLCCEDFGQVLEDAGAAERVFEAAVEPAVERAVEPVAEKPAEAAPEPEAEPEPEPEPEPVEPLPRWPLKRTGPGQYLKVHGKKAKHSKLAQKYVDAGKLDG